MTCRRLYYYLVTASKVAMECIGMVCVAFVAGYVLVMACVYAAKAMGYIHEVLR